MKDKREELRRLLMYSGWCILYVLLSAMIYSVWVDDIDYVDALYFAVVTLTTVGYGDIVITTYSHKVITIIFISVGMGILTSIFFAVISDISFRLMETTSKKKKELEKTFNNEMIDCMINMSSSSSSSRNEEDVENDDDTNEVEATTMTTSFCDVWYTLFLNIPWIIAILLPAILIGYIEKWHILDIFYFTVVTVTAVGYGDYAPSNKSMRLFSVFYLPYCFIIMSRVIGNIYNTYFQRKVKVSDYKYVHQKRHLSTPDILTQNNDNDNADLASLSYNEFLTFMLVTMMKKVDHNEMVKLKELYEQLSLDNNKDGGELSKKELYALAARASTRSSKKLLKSKLLISGSINSKMNPTTTTKTTTDEEIGTVGVEASKAIIT